MLDTLLHDSRWMMYGLQVLRLCVWLVLLAAVFIPLERLFALHPGEIFRRQIATDLGYFFLSSLLPGLVLALPLATVGWLAHRAVPDAFTEAVAGLPMWARLAASLLLGEVWFSWGIAGAMRFRGCGGFMPFTTARCTWVTW